MSGVIDNALEAFGEYLDDEWKNIVDPPPHVFQAYANPNRPTVARTVRNLLKHRYTAPAAVFGAALYAGKRVYGYAFPSNLQGVITKQKFRRLTPFAQRALIGLHSKRRKMPRKYKKKGGRKRKYSKRSGKPKSRRYGRKKRSPRITAAKIRTIINNTINKPVETRELGSGAYTCGENVVQYQEIIIGTATDYDNRGNDFQVVGKDDANSATRVETLDMRSIPNAKCLFEKISIQLKLRNATPGTAHIRYYFCMHKISNGVTFGTAYVAGLVDKGISSGTANDPRWYPSDSPDFKRHFKIMAHGSCTLIASQEKNLFWQPVKNKVWDFDWMDTVGTTYRKGYTFTIVLRIQGQVANAATTTSEVGTCAVQINFQWMKTFKRRLLGATTISNLRPDGSYPTLTGGAEVRTLFQPDVMVLDDI